MQFIHPDRRKYLLFDLPSMPYNPHKHHRRSIRLPGYDYSSSGVYFITLCTYQRECLFGEIENGTMQLNKLGQIVAEEWLKSVEIRQEIELDNWVIMPNHFHAIAILDRPQSKERNSSSVNPDRIQMKPRSLSSLVTGFKSSVTRRINQMRQNPGYPVWQRNYYEHIIRTSESWEQIYNYIDANPKNWECDRLHPAHPMPF